MLERDFEQIDRLYVSLSGVDFNNEDRQKLNDIINMLRDALAAQADPNFVSPDTADRFKAIADRINQLANDLQSDSYPGPADADALEQALGPTRLG